MSLHLSFRGVARLVCLAAILAGCDSTDTDNTVTGVTVTVDANPAAMPETVQATARVAPSNASQSVTWSSSDPSRATVDAAGVVTPLLAGPVTITATSTVDATVSGSVVLNIVCPSPRFVTQDVSDDTTWENWIPDPACFDYVVQTFVAIADETLTLEPGTVVGFESDRRLLVQDNARLIAAGTAEDPIVLKGTNAQPGFWRGLVFQNARADGNTLDHVLIEHGGADPIGTLPGANLEIQGESQLSISNSVFQNSSGFGMYVDHASTLLTFEANRMTSNTAQGAYVSARIVGSLSAGNDFLGNGINEIRVETGTNNQLEESTAWLDHGLPYSLAYLNGRQWVIDRATLTLERGVTLLMSDDLGILVREGGHIQAVGTAQSRITLDASGSGWQGLTFRDATGHFEETSILNAGSVSGGGNERGAITILTVSASEPPSSRVTMPSNPEVSGTDYEIVFGLGDTFGSCIGRVYIPPPDTADDHCA